MNSEVFAQIRDALASLYLDEDDGRIVAADAGLNLKRISFDNQATRNWHAILSQAVREDKVDKLLAKARNVFGSDEALLAAIEAYENLPDEAPGESIFLEELPPSYVPLASVMLGGIAVIIIALVLGYVFYIRNAPTTEEANLLPTVILMDSKEEIMIYNPEGGGTNTDDIREILTFLPIEPPTEEIVHPQWDGTEIIARQNPDLIIVHHSAFYDRTRATDPAQRLASLLRGMENTDAKFLIYSRVADFSDEEAFKNYYEQEFPFLEGRVDVLHVPRGDEAFCLYWSCADTKQKLRAKVKALLDIA